MIYLALLRGINVGGNKKILMVDLKKCFESMGFESVSTYIQTGNVIFESDEGDSQKLVGKIEGALKECFGFEVKVVVLKRSDLDLAVNKMPFKKIDFKKLYVMFLTKTPKRLSDEILAKYKAVDDQVDVNGKILYFYCPGGVGRSRLSNNVFEKQMGVWGTMRNWRTTITLLEKMAD